MITQERMAELRRRQQRDEAIDFVCCALTLWFGIILVAHLLPV